MGVLIEEWNILWSEDLGVYLKLIKWETHAYPAAGADAQDVINTQIDEEYDVFVGIMWKRFGTGSNRAKSGTVEEFSRAFTRFKATGSPQLMFYFKNSGLVTTDEATENNDVQRFRSGLATMGLLIWDFIDTEQFGKLIRIHLTRYIQSWAKLNRFPLSLSDFARKDLESRFVNYSLNIKNQCTKILSIIMEFAQLHLQHINSQNARTMKISSMPEEEMTEVFMMLTIIEIAEEMIGYAVTVEKFAADFTVVFSSFVESVLGAAAISIAFPPARTKSFPQALVNLRVKLHPLYESTGEYIVALKKAGVQLHGAMLTANDRSIAAHETFREHLKFGELMLIESEKLFYQKR